MNDLFRRFAQRAAKATGHALAFVLALLIVVVWLATGPMFRFSNTWQLVINTSTTIITFLMVFVLQNTQDRDNHAVQLKLDELVRAVSHARNSYIDIEELADEELDRLTEEFHQLHTRALAVRESRGKKLGGAAPGHGGAPAH